MLMLVCDHGKENPSDILTSYQVPDIYRLVSFDATFALLEKIYDQTEEEFTDEGSDKLSPVPPLKDPNNPNINIKNGPGQTSQVLLFCPRFPDHWLALANCCRLTTLNGWLPTCPSERRWSFRLPSPSAISLSSRL